METSVASSSKLPSLPSSDGGQVDEGNSLKKRKQTGSKTWSVSGHRRKPYLDGELSYLQNHDPSKPNPLPSSSLLPPLEAHTKAYYHSIGMLDESEYTHYLSKKRAEKELRKKLKAEEDGQAAGSNKRPRKQDYYGKKKGKEKEQDDETGAQIEGVDGVRSLKRDLETGRMNMYRAFDGDALIALGRALFLLVAVGPSTDQVLGLFHPGVFVEEALSSILKTTDPALFLSSETETKEPVDHEDDKM